MDYYELLEISRNASDEVIKNAYRALVKKYHPDTVNTNKEEIEEKMRQINEAYEVLSNKEKRAAYDLELKQRDLENNKIEEKSNGVNITEIYSDDIKPTNSYNLDNNSDELNKKKLKKKAIIIALIIFFLAMLISFILVSIFVEPQKSNKNKDEQNEQEEQVNEKVKDKKDYNQKNDLNSNDNDYVIKDYDDDNIIENEVEEPNQDNNNFDDDGIIKIY